LERDFGTMSEEQNVLRKELGIIGGISLAAGSTIGSGQSILRGNN